MQQQGEEIWKEIREEVKFIKREKEEIWKEKEGMRRESEEIWKEREDIRRKREKIRKKSGRREKGPRNRVE